MSDATTTEATDTAAAEAGDAAAGAEQPAAPADEQREALLATLTAALGDGVVASHIVPGRELWVRVAREAWVEAAETAKLKLGCTFFDFLSAIDWMPSPWGRYEYSALDLEDGIPRPDPTAEIATGYAGGDTRFQVFTRLANVRQHHGVMLKADLPDDDLRVASLVPLYGGANWHERECWEMFGITFDGHPGLRHLYLPGAFEGHPLRKDFPLLARLVKPWPGIVDVEPMPEGVADEGTNGTDSAEAAGESDAGDRGLEGAGGGGEAASPEADGRAEDGGDA